MMYPFIKPNEEAPPTLPAHLKTVFNGITLDDVLTDENGGFHTLPISGRGVAGYTVNTAESSMTIGGMYGGRALNVRTIVVRFRLWDKTSEGLRKRFERLNQFLQPEEAELRFTDDPHHFIATFAEAEDPEEYSNDILSSLTFICHDPHKYGQTLFLSDVDQFRFDSVLPVHPVLSIHLESEQTEVVLTNDTKNLAIHLRSVEPFGTAEPIIIDTKQWTVTQGTENRIRDLMISSDLEDFIVSPGDRITLSVPGRVDATVRRVSL
ncbi:distal tail protein Dit [Bhargavaea ginsengi]|uniref:distal tail protein Dit n=1 Tax=Bhargavaea ginsengi TaxID=426757 RepID=UPI003C74B74B